jgi:capsular polysaccharide biosynthesis protein
MSRSRRRKGGIGGPQRVPSLDPTRPLGGADGPSIRGGAMPMASPAPSSVVDLRDYVDVLRARSWTILSVTAVITIAVTAWTLLQPTVYRAAATVQVLPLVNPLISSSSRASASQPDIATEAAVAGSSAVGSIVADRSGTALSPLDLIEHVSAEPATAGNILMIDYEAPKPGRAAAFANAFADAYLAYRERTATGPIDAAIADARRSVEHLSERLVAAPTEGIRGLVSTRLFSAQESLRQLEAARHLVAAGTVIEPATPRLATSAPDVARNVALGVGVGLVLGVIAALVRSALGGRTSDRARVRPASRSRTKDRSGVRR